MRIHKVKYTNVAIGKVKLVEDFLPPPHQLVLKQETVKVTLSLSKDSVNFFKQVAQSQHTHYQTMIRALVDHYAEQHQR